MIFIKYMFFIIDVSVMQHCLAQAPVKRGDGPLALVLAPTRELAQQIEKEVINRYVYCGCAGFCKCL